MNNKQFQKKVSHCQMGVQGLENSTAAAKYLMIIYGSSQTSMSIDGSHFKLLRFTRLLGKDCEQMVASHAKLDCPAISKQMTAEEICLHVI